VWGHVGLFLCFAFCVWRFALRHLYLIAFRSRRVLMRAGRVVIGVTPDLSFSSGNWWQGGPKLHPNMGYEGPMNQGRQLDTATRAVQVLVVAFEHF
jgi:hypothetical protein